MAIFLGKIVVNERSTATFAATSRSCPHIDQCEVPRVHLARKMSYKKPLAEADGKVRSCDRSPANELSERDRMREKLKKIL